MHVGVSPVQHKFNLRVCYTLIILSPTLSNYMKPKRILVLTKQKSCHFSLSSKLQQINLRMEHSNITKYKWIVLWFLNIALIVLGLYLPLNFSCLKTNLRKTSVVVLFIIICSLLLSLIDIQRRYFENGVPFQQFFTILYTLYSCFILASRYKHYNYAQDIFSILLSLSNIQNKSCIIRTMMLDELILGNCKILLKAVALFVMLGYEAYTKSPAPYYVIHNAIVFAILVFEIVLVTEILELITKISNIIKNDLTYIYKDFYKVPPAELKKSNNGDLVLVGWISQSLDSSKTNESVVEMKKLLHDVYLLKRVIEKFNVVFQISVSISFIYLFSQCWELLWSPKASLLSVTTLKLIYICVRIFFEKYISD